MFQPTPGIAPGWNLAVGPGVERPVVVSTHTRDRSRVELASMVMSATIARFQPTPGIAPGWNHSCTLRMEIPRTFQPTPGIAPGWNRPLMPECAALPGVSTHTRDRSRVEPTAHARVRRLARCFNPHPGSLPGGTRRSCVPGPPPPSFNPHPGSLPGGTSSAPSGSRHASCFNPHPGVPPGGTVGPASCLGSPPPFNPPPGIAPGVVPENCRDDGLEVGCVSIHTRGSLPGGTSVMSDADRVLRLLTFQPTPGMVPGWNCPDNRDTGGPHGRVSTHTRIAPGWNRRRVGRLDAQLRFQSTPGIAPGWSGQRSPAPRAGQSRSNPHPGSPPGGT